MNNKSYRVIWNESTGAWQAVSEIGRRHGTSPAKSLLLATLLGVSLHATTVLASGLPTDGKVLSGTGSITETTNQLTIRQSTERMALDWKSFNIGSDKTVQFIQPSTSATALNRVSGIDASIIAGKLIANGTVILLNPSGVLFTPTAEVHVGNLVASTLKTLSDDFSKNTLTLGGDSKAAIINEGKLSAAQGGSIALIAAQVKNKGEITAPGGNVHLTAAGKVKLNFGGPVELEIEQGIFDAYVEQGGILRAQGGRIFLTARTLSQLMHTVVNHTGVSEASSAREVNGEIVLDGGPGGKVQVSGAINASGIGDGQSGGQIKIFGQNIHIGDSAQLNATGDHDGGQIFVGGGWQGASIDGRPSAVQVRIESGVTLDASSLVNGAGGMVVAWSDISNPRSLTEVHGALLTRGGKDAGNGGKIETSGYRLMVDGVTVNAASPKGSAGEWLLDPYDIKIENVTPTPNLIESGSDPITISPPANTTIIKPSTIMEALKNSNVIITTGSNGAQAGDITVASQLIQPSYSISINGTQTTQQFQLPSERTLTLKAARSIVFDAGTGIDATLNQNTQKLNVVLWADSDASGGGNVVMKGSSTSGVTIRTRGGGLWIGGGSESATNNWAPSGTTATMKVGIGPAEGYIDSNVTDFQKTMGVSMDYTTITTGSGNVTITGRGSNSTDSSNKGVRLFETAIETNTGSITIRGQGGGTVSSTNGVNTGIYIYKYASVSNAAAAPALLSNSGTILLEGRGGNTDAAYQANDGVSLNGETPLIRTTGSGTIEVKGVSGNMSASSTAPTRGVSISGPSYGDPVALIEAVGSGTITISGSATRDGVGRSGGKQIGLLISRAGIAANGGKVTLEGQGSDLGALNASNTSRGVVLENGAVGSNSGDITINGQSFSTASSPSAGVELASASLSTAAPNIATASGSISINADHLKMGKYVDPYMSQSSVNNSLSQTSPASIIKTGVFSISLSPVSAGQITINTPASSTSDALIESAEKAISMKALRNEVTVDVARTNITLKSPGDLTLNEGVSLPVVDEAIHTALWANTSGNGGSVVLKTGSVLNTVGGNLWIGGGSSSTTWEGMTVGNGAATGTGITRHGVVIDGAKILTAGGSVLINGAGASCAQEACDGVVLSRTAQLNAITNPEAGGNVVIRGATQGGSSQSAGIRIGQNQAAGSSPSASGQAALSFANLSGGSINLQTSTANPTGGAPIVLGGIDAANTMPQILATAGDITFGSLVRVTGDTRIRSHFGKVEFQKPVNGAADSDLMIGAGKSIVFLDDVGAANPLSLLHLQSPEITIKNVTTSGNQSYGNLPGKALFWVSSPFQTSSGQINQIRLSGVFAPGDVVTIKRGSEILTYTVTDADLKNGTTSVSGDSVTAYNNIAKGLASTFGSSATASTDGSGRVSFASATAFSATDVQIDVAAAENRAFASLILAADTTLRTRANSTLSLADAESGSNTSAENSGITIDASIKTQQGGSRALTILAVGDETTTSTAQTGAFVNLDAPASQLSSVTIRGRGVRIANAMSAASGVSVDASEGILLTPSAAISVTGGDVVLSSKSLALNGTLKTGGSGSIRLTGTSDIVINGRLEADSGAIEINKGRSITSYGSIRFGSTAILKTALTEFSANGSVLRLQSAALATGALPLEVYPLAAFPQFATNSGSSAKTTFSAGLLATGAGQDNALATPIIFAKGDVEAAATTANLDRPIQLGTSAAPTDGGGMVLMADNFLALNRQKSTLFTVLNPNKTVQITSLTPQLATTEEVKQEVATVVKEVSSVVRVAALGASLANPGASLSGLPAPFAPRPVAINPPGPGPQAPATPPSQAPSGPSGGASQPVGQSGQASSDSPAGQPQPTSGTSPTGQQQPPQAASAPTSGAPSGPAPAAPAAPATAAAAGPAAQGPVTQGPSAPPPVAPPPPSPVAAEKPPTPRDTADTNDRTLASAAPTPPPRPADRPQRAATRTVAVSPVVSVQVPTPPRPVGRQAAEQRVSLQGNSGRW